VDAETSPVDTIDAAVIFVVASSEPVFVEPAVIMDAEVREPVDLMSLADMSPGVASEDTVAAPAVRAPDALTSLAVISPGVVRDETVAAPDVREPVAVRVRAETAPGDVRVWTAAVVAERVVSVEAPVTAMSFVVIDIAARRVVALTSVAVREPEDIAVEVRVFVAAVSAVRVVDVSVLAVTSPGVARFGAVRVPVVTDKDSKVLEPLDVIDPSKDKDPREDIVPAVTPAAFLNSWRGYEAGA
jgi:hypothetical protein